VIENKGKFIVGKIADFEKRKGWFFGRFSEHPLLRSDLVEVAFQDISQKEASPNDKHLHTSSIEINIVLSGKVSLTINGQKFKVGEGEFYVVWPESVVEDLRTTENTKLIVIRAPSVNDKRAIE
jgi:quercetin dioxygenase-like cupin family protein